ncbi:MAG: DUF3311 domain-containing protein [Planctomycetota bacterium]
MQKVVWGLVVLLLIVHQDVWFWRDDTLVFGFVPVGLFFHASISVAASVAWFLATRHCWPASLEGEAPGGEAAA